MPGIERAGVASAIRPSPQAAACPLRRRTRVVAASRRSAACRTRLLARAVGLLCAALLVWGCRRNASQELAEGERLLSLDQAGRALAQFQAALTRQPSARAHRGAGLAEEALQSYTAAREHLQAAVEADPKDIQARLGLLRIATRLRRLDAARQQLDALVTLAPKQHEVALLSALYAREEQELAQAAERLQALPSRSREALIVAADLARRRQPDAAADILERSRRATAPMHSERESEHVAIAAYQLEHFELSAALLEAVLSRAPQRADAQRWLIRAYLQLGEARKARLAMARLPADEGDPDLALLRAQVLLANDQVVAAERSLQALLQAPSATRLLGEARLTLADALDRLGKHEAARGLWAELLRDPVHQKAAWLRQAEGADATGCKHVVTAAAKLQSHHLADPDVRLHLGRCQLLGDDDGAAQASLAPLKRLPAYAPRAALLLLTDGDRNPSKLPTSAALLGHLAQYPTHVASWRACLRWLPQALASQGQVRKQLESRLPDVAQAPKIHALYGRWLAFGGQHHAARDTLRAVLQGQPDQLLAAQGLAALYRVLDKPALAHAVLDSAVSANPRSRPMRLAAAWTLAELGDGIAAQRQLEAADGYDPGHPRIHATWALIAAEFQHDVAAARQHLATAQAADPRAAATLDAQGWLAHLGGESQAAVPTLREAVAEQPLNALFRYHLGAALLALSSPSARGELEATTELDPFFYRRDEVGKALKLTPKRK